MKKYLGIIALAILLVQCKKEDDYTIAKGQLGKITKQTEVNGLEAFFKKDSLVSRKGEGEFADAPFDEYLVYAKDGKHLLTLIPKQQQDSSATIESIQIFDKRYKTTKGLNINSVFKDIAENYTINKIESTFSNAVLFIDELNATIAISKKEVGVEEFSMQKVRLDQIPDNAKINYFTLWFD